MSALLVPSELLQIQGYKLVEFNASGTRNKKFWILTTKNTLVTSFYNQLSFKYKWGKHISGRNQCMPAGFEIAQQR